MTKRVLLWSAVLALAGIAIVGNIFQLVRHNRAKHELLDNGFIQSAILLNESHTSFQSGKTDTALSYLSMASGSLVALDGLLSQEGVHHVAGICLELNQADRVISHPAGHSKSEVTAMTSFVRYAAQDFATIMNDSHLSAKQVQQVIDEAYLHMPAKDRSVFYSDGD